MHLLWAILLFWLVPTTAGATIISTGMDTLALEQKINQLISNLQYSSESDYPLELLRWGHKSPAALQAAIRENNPGHVPEQRDAAAFFSRYIQAQVNSGDPEMIKAANKYKALWELLSKQSSTVTVWRNGQTRVDIYIVITAKDGQLLLIKTTSVET